jgi:hypothetical protein
MSDERNFYRERLLERALELRRRCSDAETYRVELAKLLVGHARNDTERQK